MLKVAITVLGTITLSAGAMAQNTLGTIDITPQETPALRRNTIEIQPLQTALSAVPGIGSVGMAYESYLTKQWAGVISGSYTDVDISQVNIDMAREDTDKPLPTAGYGYSVGVGARYYEDPIGNSLYGGAAVNYSEQQAEWDYQDETFTSNQYTVTPTLTAGYRWVWQNGFLLRLGAGAGLPKNDSLKVAPAGSLALATDGTEEIEDILQQPVVPILDLGLGVSF